MTGGDRQHLQAATILRRAAAALLRLPDPNRIILGPGVLACLNHVLLRRCVNNLLLVRDGYFEAEVFRHIERVVVVEMDDLIPHVSASPDAVFASLVGPTGRREALAERFAAVRLMMGDRRPLLIADCSHAGAIGFPDLSSLGADIVCGDLSKWVAAPDTNKVAYLWTASSPLDEEVRSLFSGYYLGVEGGDLARSGTFAHPEAVVGLARMFQSRPAMADYLRKQHESNLLLARRLSGKSDIETCIVVQKSDTPEARSRVLHRYRLATDLPNGDVRLLARADLWPSATLYAERLIRNLLTRR